MLLPFKENTLFYYSKVREYALGLSHVNVLLPKIVVYLHMYIYIYMRVLDSQPDQALGAIRRLAWEQYRCAVHFFDDRGGTDYCPQMSKCLFARQDPAANQHWFPAYQSIAAKHRSYFVWKQVKRYPVTFSG